MDEGKIKEDFSFLKEDVNILAVLVFGSQVTGQKHERSDTDICVVAPDAEPSDVMRKVWRNVKTEKKGYDVHTFEEFNLKMKHEVMENYEIIWCEDKPKLQEYFYKYRKLWKDQAKARGVA